MATVTLEWAIAKIAGQAREIENLNNCIALLEREIKGEVDTAQLSLLPDDIGGDPLNTGTFKALNQARLNK